MTVQYWLDNNTILIGDVIESDDSFDHAFGTEKQMSTEVKNLNVLVFINGIEKDITKAFSDKELNQFRDVLLEYAYNGKSEVS